MEPWVKVAAVLSVTTFLLLLFGAQPGFGGSKPVVDHELRDDIRQLKAAVNRCAASASSASPSASASAPAPVEHRTIDEVLREPARNERKVPDCIFPAPPDGTDKMNGQVNEGTTFGRALEKLAAQPDVHLFLETGAWNGRGSSKMIARGLTSKDKSSPGFMFTFEGMLHLFIIARESLKDFPVRVLFGATIAREQQSTLEDLEREMAGSGYPNMPLLRQIFAEEWANSVPHEVPMLEPLCRKYKFDAALVDSSEIAGPTEFNIIHDICKPKYIAFHDTKPFKNHRNQRIIKEGLTDYEVMEVSPADDEAGWLIAKRKAQPKGIQLMKMDFDAKHPL